MEEKKKLKVKIGPTGLKGVVNFALSDKLRDRVIKNAPVKEIIADYPINRHAAERHPDVLHLKVLEITELPGCNAKKIVLASQNGEPLPYFRAGQYLSLRFMIGSSTATRAYSICSSPDLAAKGRYEIAVRSVQNGFVSGHILNALKVGDMVISSAPQGEFYYEPIRDARTVLALAGGSGVTPFLSMAKAIAEGTENFGLILLYGSRTYDGIMFRRELDALAAECPKIKLVYVLSDEVREGFEHGFIGAELIQKYAPAEDHSVFICGPEAMYTFEQKELKKLGLPARRVRAELQSVSRNVALEPGYPSECAGKEFKLTLHRWGKVYEIPCRADEPLLVAIERAGIVTPSRCRSGSCGWCRSKLMSGDVFIPPKSEARRWADRELNYIHPCCSFPLSDIEMDVPGETV